jgi:hypothetical protein
MASTGRPSQSKRKRETDLKARQQEKISQRAQRKTEKENRPPGQEGEDPDIAGIVPGPQPIITEDEPE